MDGLGAGGRRGTSWRWEKTPPKSPNGRWVPRFMSSRKRLVVKLDRDVWYCNSRGQGMAGSSLTRDDLWWAWLCAGFEVREEMQQHRVSTEGGKRRDDATGRVVFLQVMAAQRVARSAAKRSGRQVWVLPALRSVYAASRRRRCGRGVGWVRGLTWCQVFGAVDDRRKGGEAPCGVSAAPAVGRAWAEMM